MVGHSAKNETFQFRSKKFFLTKREKFANQFFPIQMVLRIKKKERNSWKLSKESKKKKKNKNPKIENLIFQSR